MKNRKLGCKNDELCYKRHLRITIDEQYNQPESELSLLECHDAQEG